jgi:hypothetical protein
VVEVEADEVAPSLRWAIAKPERATNGSKGKGEFNDDAPSSPAAVRPGRRPPSRPRAPRALEEVSRMHPNPTRPMPEPALHLLGGIWIASSYFSLFTHA